MTPPRRAAWIASAVAVAVLGAAAVLHHTSGHAETAFRDAFDRRDLGGEWTPTASGDFSESSVGIAPDAGGRLRVRAGTVGTRDDTVKYLGARTTHPVVDAPDVRVSAELDWNGQANGSYLSSELVLSPRAVTDNPLTGPDWIRVAYVGVPPGRNARIVVAASAGGRVRTLFDEGWPDVNRSGRAIGRQRVELLLSGTQIQVVENGARLYSGALEERVAEPSFVYLQLSTHSNYAARDLYFDDVAVERL